MLPNLKLLRQERGISQQKLADILGLRQQTINYYENHKIEPDIGTLIRIAEYFETSVDYVIGNTNIRHKIEPTTTYHLNDTESELLSKYRALSPAQRACVIHVIDTILEK